MPNLTIKSLPPTLHERLRGRASANHRSINKEVIAILSQAIERDERHRPDADALLRRADMLRSRMHGPGIDIEVVNRAIEQGRS